MVVVVFLTTTVTWTSPQRSAVSAGPVIVLVAVTTFFLTARTAVERAAATTLPTGIKSAAAETATVVALRMDLLYLVQSAKRSTWRWRRRTPAWRRESSTRFVIAGGPQRKTSRSARSGTSSRMCSGVSSAAPSGVA